MKCPHCGHDHSRVMETRAGEHADRRIRICKGCGSSFYTLERVSVYAGRATGYIEVGQPAPNLEVVPTPEKKPAAAKAARYRAGHEKAWPCGPDAMSYEVRNLLVQWWNESRWSKHKGKATWTEAAWLSSLNRVARLAPELQRQLAKAGVEYGWQALKVEFLDSAEVAAAAGPRPGPKDPAMREALASW
jgi:hypothetical protein